MAALRGTVGYGVARALARLLLRLFYGRIEVVGLERVPREGALIVAANHHNSAVDAMLLIAFVPRRLHPLANAPLFGHPFLGPLLRLVGALPVHRRLEGGVDPARNAALFAATEATLREGGAILVFPEGRTQPEPVLLELRTGAARMLLAAETGRRAPTVTLLPVGLVLQDPGVFRKGRVLVQIGDPVVTADLVGSADPAEVAVRSLTRRLTLALRRQILEADDRHALGLLTLVDDLGHAASPPVGETARFERLQRALHAYRSLLGRDPDRIAAFEEEIEAYAAEVAEGAATFLTPASRWARLRSLLREALPLVAWAPLALLGIVLHGPAYRLTALVARRIPHTDEEEATDKIFAGLVAYPLVWAIEAWSALRVGGFRGVAALGAALLPAGYLALAWRERLDRLVAQAGAFARVGRDPGLPERVRRKREALLSELGALRRLAHDGRASGRPSVQGGDPCL
jgi:glycerol-3-phosphate O-acyltransferase / dihydroxyacetone phosphate acyltransferase